MTDVTSVPSDEPQLSAGSIDSTPESAGVTTPNESSQGDEQVTPQPKKANTTAEGGEGRGTKSKMPPPPLPINVINPTPPKMARLPSLQQISSRLNGSASASGETTPTPSTANGGSPAPKLSLSTNVPPSASSTSPFASSPSGRLKMPASAMKRTQSQQGNVTPLAESSTASSFFGSTSTAEPTSQSPAPVDPVTATATTTTVPAPPPLTRGMSTDGYIKGYKDVPSLAQIKSHVKGKEVNGEAEKDKEKQPEEEEAKPAEAKPAEQEVKKDDKGKGRMVEPEVPITTATEAIDVHGSYPLEHTWVLYYDFKDCKPDRKYIAHVQDNRPMMNEYEANLVKVGTMATVQNFAQHFNNIRIPSKVPPGSNYHLFKKGIAPMWEDPVNAKGGKWVLLFRPGAEHLTDIAWSHIVMGLVGGYLDPKDEVAGVVVSPRAKQDRVQIWTRSRGDEDPASLNELGKRIYASLELAADEVGQVAMEFQYNEGQANPVEGRFFKITFPLRGERSAPGLGHPNAPNTPSRLHTSHIPPRPDASPSGTSSATMQPPSPTPMANGRLAAPRTSAEGMRRVPSSQGMGAFSGPMGGGGGMPRTSSRLGVAGGSGRT